MEARIAGMIKISDQDKHLIEKRQNGDYFMKVYFMRHGETDWNAQVRLQGCADVPLNENGRRLAKVTGEALKEIPFDVAYSSPLSRAVETAELVLGDRKVPIITDERIKEISFGDWEGRRCKKEFNEIPQDMLDHFFREPDKYVAPPNGETFEQILSRTRAFYDELVQKSEYENSNILVSSHGAAVRAILQCVYRDGNYWQNGVPKNCAITIVEIKGGEIISVEPDRIFYDPDETPTASSFNKLFNRE